MNSKMPRKIFIRKFLRNLFIGLSIILCSLILGMLGYHHFEEMNWVDAYENAAMILSGMGPANPVLSNAGKIFAGTYALFSGIIFLVVIAITFSPIVHRLFRAFHMDEDK